MRILGFVRKTVDYFERNIPKALQRGCFFVPQNKEGLWDYLI